MNIQRRLRTTCGLAVTLAMFTSIGVAAGAQEATVQGLVIGRDGPTMSVKTSDTPRLTVVLSDSTQATEKGGFLGLDRKHPAITELVPGLSVKIEGTYDPDHKLIAKKVSFSRSSFETAREIDAGLNPVNEQVASAQDQLRSNRKDIDQTQQDLAQNQQDINSAKQGIASNTTGIGQANQRFTTLDQYATKDSLTINFANGRSTVTSKYKDQLADFLKSVGDTPGYMIEVQGYASAVGSPTLNQRLSAERADAVLALIQQSGVPLTRILAPAAMGVTEQVADNHSRSGQAQNRRVVVTIVVNKGITGAETGEAAGVGTGAPS